MILPPGFLRSPELEQRNVCLSFMSVFIVAFLKPSIILDDAFALHSSFFLHAFIDLPEYEICSSRPPLACDLSFSWSCRRLA